MRTPKKWLNTIKQFAGNSRWIVWVFDHFVGLVFKGLIHTQYAIIEIYHGTFQPRDFPYLSICFVTICKIWHVLLKRFGIVWEVNIFDFCCYDRFNIFLLHIYLSTKNVVMLLFIFTLLSSLNPYNPNPKWGVKI